MASVAMLDPKRRGNEAEKLHTRLGQLVVGQEEAIREIVDIYQLYRTGLNAPGRPIGNFLVPGANGLREDAPGGGHCGVLGQRSESRDQDRLRRIPAQP